MSAAEEPSAQALRIALTILAAKEIPRPSDVDAAVTGAIAALGAMGIDAPVEPVALRRAIEANVNVFVGDDRLLTDPDDDHQPWLADRDRSDWRFWNAYRAYQLQKGMPHSVVRNLDRLTDRILDGLTDPQQDGAWDRRGMVVGQVQSGKTSNYTGLICKAADAGYKFIVVLAGLHNSLRSQTQQRLDEGFLGLDSRTSLGGALQRNRQIGVGAGGRTHPAVLTLTSSEDSGDFNRGVAARVAGRLGETPTLLVVKKNKSVLENLIEWVTSTNGQRDPETGRMTVRGLPLLVIDDEADNASVNTRQFRIDTDDDGNETETEPAKINALIRRLLGVFDQSAFVAYTATPFANIFIAEEEHPKDKWHEDLFPRSFIARLPPPSNYLGPTTVFGVRPAGDVREEDPDELPIIRPVKDHEIWLRPGHKKDEIPGPVPGSLKQAIRAFILTCAARAARGEASVHNSMLVHVTHLVAVQGLVAEQVRDELGILQDRLRYREVDDALAEFEELWTSDFNKTFRAMPGDLRGADVSWDAVAAELDRAAQKIEVMVINGSATEALVYGDRPEGVSVIAVGGNKLSRGLTLEGLSVSYYLRTTKMYDSLMQMGRWFGYRPDYTDLCRLYTTPELVSWYRETTVANEELLEKFDEMEAQKRSPRDFALFVRKSPAGLMVTAPGKMRTAREMKLSFSGAIIETVNFRKQPQAQRDNLGVVEGLLRDRTPAPPRTGPAGNLVFRGLSGEEVARALIAWRVSDSATKARGEVLARYIRARLAEGELTDWTVALISSATPEAKLPVAGYDVGLIRRTPQRHASDYAIKRIVSPKDEALDLSADEFKRALDTSPPSWRKQNPHLPAGTAVRAIRPVSRGMLILYPLDPYVTGEDGGRNPIIKDYVGPIMGWAVSFPVSEGAPDINYAIPARFWEDEVNR